MFFNLIVASLQKFYDSLFESKGILLVSGILVYDRDEVIKRSENIGFKLVTELREDEWCGFLFKIC